MAPIKFEEQLKDKLEKRSLQPSADSWAKLSERLDKEDNTSRKPWLGWLSIAAGVIILLAIMVRTLGSNDTQDIEPQFVEEDKIEKVIEQPLPVVNENNTIELVAEDTTLEKEVINDKVEQAPKVIIDKAVIKEKAKVELANNDKVEDLKSEPLIMDKTPQTIILEEAQIDKDAVAKALIELKTEKTTVTDREVDSLLKLASKELVKDKLLKNTSSTVDAQSLLDDVEDEMGQSFRSKVYEALKDGYKTVKTAVAERNN